MTYHCFCTGNKYLTLGKEYILREITFVKSESSSKHKTKLCTKLNKMFTYMDGINYPVLVSPPLLTQAYNYKWMGWMDGWMGWLSLGLEVYRAPTVLITCQHSFMRLKISRNYNVGLETS